MSNEIMRDNSRRGRKKARMNGPMKALKELRERAGHTLRGFARLIGMSASRYQYYEKGFKRRYFPAEFIDLISPHLVGRGLPTITVGEVRAMGGHHHDGSAAMQKYIGDGSQPPIEGQPPAGVVSQISHMPKDVPLWG